MTPKVSFFDTLGVNFENPWSWVVLALALALVIQSLRLWWLRGQAARRIARHQKLGKWGEKQAQKLLAHYGYQVVSSQAPGSYQLVVDDRMETIRLRADFLVETTSPRFSLLRGVQRDDDRDSGTSQRGGLFVAEVKAGREATKITARATRRQLLEYLLAFEVDGVVLVDVERRHVSVVQFPERPGQ